MNIEVTQEQLAYIAGLFDGEGCVHIGGRRQNSSYNLEVSLSNTNRDVLFWIQSIFGGYIKEQKKAKEYHTQCYNWRIVSNQAVLFLESIYPYMRIKLNQADGAIAFQSLMRMSDQTSVIKNAERLIYEAMRKR